MFTVGNCSGDLSLSLYVELTSIQTVAGYWRKHYKLNTALEVINIWKEIYIYKRIVGKIEFGC